MKKIDIILIALIIALTYCVVAKAQKINDQEIQLLQYYYNQQQADVAVQTQDIQGDQNDINTRTAQIAQDQIAMNAEITTIQAWEAQQANTDSSTTNTDVTDNSTVVPTTNTDGVNW